MPSSIMRPVSPAPLHSRTRQLLSDGDGGSFHDGATRSSSLPPRNRVSFAGINRTVAPCSKEFLKSMTDLNRENEREVVAQEKLTLPIIHILKRSEKGEAGSDVGEETKTRVTSWNDSVSTNNGHIIAHEDISNGWTTLSKVGLLRTLEPKRGRQTKSEYSYGDTIDDNMSVRSDSHLITRHSSRSLGKSTGKRTQTPAGAHQRMSRRDESKPKQRAISVPESLSPRFSSSRLSPLARPQATTTGSLQRPALPYQSKSANTSPEQPRRKDFSSAKVGGSAPSSPLGSPALTHRANSAKRVFDKPQWNASSNHFTNSYLNPIIAKVDTTVTTGQHTASCVNKRGPYSDVVAYNFAKRGGRVRKDAWRLSDLSLDDYSPVNHANTNLEDEFRRLKGCRYLRGCVDDENDEEADVRLDEHGKISMAGSA